MGKITALKLIILKIFIHSTVLQTHHMFYHKSSSSYMQINTINYTWWIWPQMKRSTQVRYPSHPVIQWSTDDGNALRWGMRHMHSYTSRDKLSVSQENKQGELLYYYLGPAPWLLDHLPSSGINRVNSCIITWAQHHGCLIIFLPVE